MIQDEGRRERRSSGVSTAAARLRRRTEIPAVEVLEGRQLLSIYTGPTTSRPVAYKGAVFTVTVEGGGYNTVRRMKGGQFAINVFATNPDSTLSITAQPRKARYANTSLKIGQLNVKTGQLGAINAGSADLLGTMSSLSGTVSSIQFNKIGRSATIDVEGNLGGLSAAQVELGPTGRIRVGGDLTGPVGGSLHLDGGQFLVGQDATGALSPGNLIVEHGGILSIGHDLSGGINIAGNLIATTNGLIKIGNDLGGLTVGKALGLDTGGRLIVGGDVAAAGTVSDGINISNDGLLAVGRDFTEGLTIGGNLSLDTRGSFLVGRDLGGLNVGGDLRIAPAGGQVRVRGNLTDLRVDGALRGKGSSESLDLFVGLDLNGLTVLGGGAFEGGIQDANIDVGKNIVGVNVQHGIFHSLITAGVLIDGTGGGAGTGAAATVGADGVDAILNSEIRAGVEIRNVTIGGDVRSDFVTNPAATGYPTRILAGVDRQGQYLTGGQIDNFQITGTLIDSVLAASVAPSGGDGTLPPNGYGPPPVPSGGSGDRGNNTYDAPGGVIFGGSVAAPVPYINYSEITYFNETFKEMAYDTNLDPTIDDFILPGAINPSFATPPLTQAQLAGPSVTVQSQTGTTITTGETTLDLPLPSKSTVLGGVVSHRHSDDRDFAGLFAADTRGVFIGTLPD